MTPIRVLHCITRLILGGAQENTLLTVEGLHRRPEYSVALLTGQDDGPEGDLLARARGGGYPLIVVPELVRPLHPVNDPIALVKLVRAIRRGGYDIVHTHSTKAGLLGRVAARLAGTPVVVHTLHSLAFHAYQPRAVNFGLRVMKRLLAPYTDHFISVADAVREGALAAGIGRAEQHSTIYSGMQLDSFLDARPERTGLRRELGIPEDALVVVKVARLFHLKGHAELFPALPTVVRAVPNVRILLVGDGVLRERLEAEATRLGIRGSLVFAGLVRPERVPDFIGAADVLVHTSLREGLPRVVPQALAMGKPVVAVKLDGTPEVVRPGVTGYLVRPDRPDELAEALVTVLRDPALRERLGASGRRLVGPMFREETMVERIHQVYARLLAAKGMRPERAAMPATESLRP